MVLVEKENNTGLDIHRLEWVVLPEKSDLHGIEPSLHYVSEGCKKKERKEIFKKAYEKLMDQIPNATYQEKLDISNKVISELQEQNPDINPNVFKSLKRSFAARTGYEITRLRKELKTAESTITLPNGKEIQNKHPWSYVIDKVTDVRNNKQKKGVLVKIYNFRSKLKSIIKETGAPYPEEMLKTCEIGITELLCKATNPTYDTFLSDNNVNTVINNRNKLPLNYKYMSAEAYKTEDINLKSWVEKLIIRNNPQGSTY